MRINDLKQKSWWIVKSMQKLPVCLVAQLYPTLCNPIHCSSPNSSTSGLSFPCPGDLPNPGIEPRSPTLQLNSLPSKSPGKPQNSDNSINIPCQGEVVQLSTLWGWAVHSMYLWYDAMKVACCLWSFSLTFISPV